MFDIILKLSKHDCASLAVLLLKGDDWLLMMFPLPVQTSPEPIWNHFIRLRPKPESIRPPLRDEVSWPLCLLAQKGKSQNYFTLEDRRGISFSGKDTNLYMESHDHRGWGEKTTVHSRTSYLLINIVIWNSVWLQPKTSRLFMSIHAAVKQTFICLLFPSRLLRCLENLLWLDFNVWNCQVLRGDDRWHTELFHLNELTCCMPCYWTFLIALQLGHSFHLFVPYRVPYYCWSQKLDWPFFWYFICFVVGWFYRRREHMCKRCILI